MATSDSTSQGGSYKEQLSKVRYELDGCRADVVFEATAEIEATTAHGIELIERELSMAPTQALYVLRGMMARMKTLNGAVMSAIGEPDLETDALDRMVRPALPH